MKDSPKNFRSNDQMPDKDQEAISRKVIEPTTRDEMESEEDDQNKQSYLTEESPDISKQELKDLEHAEDGLSSDESLNANLLDEEDSEGALLNEASTAENLFDTGENLDISFQALNHDGDT